MSRDIVEKVVSPPQKPVPMAGRLSSWAGSDPAGSSATAPRITALATLTRKVATGYAPDRGGTSAVP
jgi:hypothetical protein